MIAEPLEDLVDRARAAEPAARDALVRAIQDRVYGLAVRMLGDPTEAQDATQEILVKVVANLASYRGESAFPTWVYRVASNHLLNARARRPGQMEMTFDGLGAMLDQGLAHRSDAPEVEDRLLEEEVKLGCTHSMLMCLDREHRLAFILGEVVELSSEEGAYVLGTTREAFRKRVSRARARLREFMVGRCGLVDGAAPCRCHRQVPFALAAGILQPARLRFADHPALPRMRELERLERVVAVFRAHPDYAAPDAFAARVRELVDSGTYGVLSD